MAYVLVVDDDGSIRQLLRTLLTGEGHEVGEASDGAEALTMVEQRMPELILLDLNMPGMHGWRFLDELYTRGLRERTRVIVVSAHAELGAPRSISPRRVLAKPFELDALLELVAQTLAEEPRAIREQSDRSQALLGLLAKVERVLG